MSNYDMVDLHRHDEFSLFDGYGKAKELALIAKAKGHTAFSTANHGNTNGLIQHYQACKEVGIKPILGVEGYFKVKLNELRKSYHLCLFCKDLEGYENLNKLMSIAEEQKYYNPIITLEDLKKYNKGLICTSACIASLFSQLILNGKVGKCKKLLAIFKSIFGDDFYIEIQPYKVDENRTQERINEQLILLGNTLNIPFILTSDSHYGQKEDFETYKKMHAIAKHNIDIEQTYKERYIPTRRAITLRFQKMHAKFIKQHLPGDFLDNILNNFKSIIDKVDGDILDKIKPELPVFDEKVSSYTLLVRKVKEGLKKRSKYNKAYIKRAKEELEVIKALGFSDYFLIVQDYVNFAKNNGIAVGAGRGSGCNSIINYALFITEVDSLAFNLDFRRFLRIDKKKMPE